MPSYVVTGASRGIGLEFVRQLSSKADNVVFGLVRSKARCSELLQLAGTHKNVHILEADLTDYKSLQTAAAEVAKVTSGTLDNLINNAAYVPTERMFHTLDAYAGGQEELLEKDFSANMNVNVLGTIHTINAFLPLLKASSATRTVRVVALTSALADLDSTLVTGFAGQPVYSISKAAVNMVIAKYAVRLREEDFVFLAISPGLVNTMVSPPDEEFLREAPKMIARLKKAAPQWNGFPSSPDEAVTKMLRVIEKAKPKDSGAFVSHHGNKQWL